MALIAFEGIDGAGKSTQAKRLSDWLEARGFRTLVTFEPTHGEHGKRIRNADPRLEPEEERAEFVLDRKEHVETCITPALERDEIVICDRYYYSSMAYQGARIAKERGDESGEALDRIINELRMENELFAPQADILVIFELSVDASLARIACGRASADAFENRDNLARVARAMDRLKLIVKATSRTRLILIDAEASVDDVTKQLLSEIAASFNLEF